MTSKKAVILKLKSGKNKNPTWNSVITKDTVFPTDVKTKLKKTK